MRSILSLIVTVAVALPLSAQKNCSKGKPCGNSCIARDKTCRVGASTSGGSSATPHTYSAPAAAAAVAATRTQLTTSTGMTLQDLAILSRMGGESATVRFQGGEEFALSPAVRDILRMVTTQYQAEVRARLQASASRPAPRPVGHPELLDTSRTYPRSAADSSYIGSLATGLYLLACGRTHDIPPEKRRYFRTGADADRAGFVRDDSVKGCR